MEKLRHNLNRFQEVDRQGDKISEGFSLIENEVVLTYQQLKYLTTEN